MILCGIENDNVIKMFDTSIPKSNIIQSVRRPFYKNNNKLLIINIYFFIFLVN